jgi:integrase/recombinase XerD
MLLFLDTGIRLSEIEHLSTYDIRFADKMLHVRAAKGFRERLVPLSKNTVQQLKVWLRIRGANEQTEALFVNLKGYRMKRRDYQNDIAKYGKKAGIENVRCSPHTFRHTFAKISVMNGAGVFDLQTIMGHSTLEMARVYVHLFSKDLQKNHEKFSPVKNLNIFSGKD